MVLLLAGLAFGYTDGYSVLPKLEVDSLIINTEASVPTLNLTTTTSDVTVATPDVNVPILVNGVILYLKASPSK